MPWSWRYEDVDGQPVDGPAETFSSQADAESWIGQNWRELAADRGQHGRPGRGRPGGVPDEPAAGGVT